MDKIKKKKLIVGEHGRLNEVVIGQRAKVLAVNSDNPNLKRRFRDMGLTPGVEIKVNKVAPMGDPVDISLRGYSLCVRKNDVKNIEVEITQ